MKTLNFEILRENAPDLAETGGFAERYVHTDPASSVVKLRIIAEQIVLHIFNCLDITLPDKPKLCDLLNDPAFQHVAPLTVRYKLDAVRIHGNAGAHGQHISEETSLWLLHETFQLVCWFFLTYICRDKQPCPEYQAPSEPSHKPSRHAKTPAKDEPEEPREEPMELPAVAESRSVSYINYNLSEPALWETIEPLVDIRAMLTRQQLRMILGKKSQDEVTATGEKAAAYLHLEESPAPE